MYIFPNVANCSQRAIGSMLNRKILDDETSKRTNRTRYSALSFTLTFIRSFRFLLARKATIFATRRQQRLENAPRKRSRVLFVCLRSKRRVSRSLRVETAHIGLGPSDLRFRLRFLTQTKSADLVLLKQQISSFETVRLAICDGAIFRLFDQKPRLPER